MEQKLTYRIKLRDIGRGILQHSEWGENPPPTPPPHPIQNTKKSKNQNGESPSQFAEHVHTGRPHTGINNSVFKKSSFFSMKKPEKRENRKK